jgi:hypothetical protein
MTTGAKIAIGCVVAVVLAGVAAVVMVGVGAWWVKGKVQEVAGPMAERTAEMERYEKKANANPFTEPADGVVPEARLVKFIDVRKRVYAVYEGHRAEFEEMKHRKDATLSDVMKVGGLLFDARLAVVKSLAEVGMSEDEYHFIVQQVYQSAWASAAQEGTGKLPSEAIQDAAKDAQKQYGEAMEKADKSGADTGLSEADRKKAAEAIEEMKEQAEKGAAMLKAPEANVALFRKYEADLKKYAMEGLAFAGL